MDGTLPCDVTIMQGREHQPGEDAAGPRPEPGLCVAERVQFLQSRPLALAPLALALAFVLPQLRGQELILLLTDLGQLLPGFF